MRKVFIYLLLSILYSSAVSAQKKFLFENWYDCNSSLPEGWTTVGSDKTPDGISADYFSAGEGMKVMSLPGSGMRCAVSYSSTTEGGKVKTELISPATLIPESGAVLSFVAANYNPTGTTGNRIGVYVEDVAAGTRSKAILNTRVAANSFVNPQICVASLADYSGKEIRIVLTNEGNNNSLLGFTDITVAEYVAYVTDRTSLFSPSETERDFDLSLSLYAPSNGMTATLTSTNGISETLSSDAVINEELFTGKLPFTSKIKLNSGEVMGYTLTVTPDCAPGSPFVYSASTGCGEGFPSVVVEEEATGERCGYCPAGAAGLDKFADVFGNRFIGMAIHCTETFSTRVMENPEYSDPFVFNPRFPIAGLPDAVLNRSEEGSPTTYDGLQLKIEKMLNVNSVAKAEIIETVYDKDSEEMTVRFNTTLSMPLYSTDLKAAVVLLADSLSGTTRNWFQTNYFSGTSEVKFMETAGEEWWPYMRFYCEYPSKQISPTDMKYNHVAMGIYPDFFGNGSPLPSDWIESDIHTGEIAFTVPMQRAANEFGVQDIRNTSVVALVIDSRSGRIVAADKMHADRYSFGSGVRDCMDDERVSVESTLDLLKISSESESEIQIFSILGECVATGRTSCGEATFNIPAQKRMLIVWVSAPDGVVARKILH